MKVIQKNIPIPEQSYYKKMVTIEYEVNGIYKNAVSISDGITKLNF